MMDQADCRGDAPYHELGALVASGPRQPSPDVQLPPLPPADSCLRARGDQAGQPPAGTRVLIFGDSWAEDNAQVDSGLFAGVQGWPVQLASILGLPIAGNFAQGQSASSSLRVQLQTALEALGADAPWSQAIVILHSGGNDFIGAEKNYNPCARGNFWLAHCTFGFRKQARAVLQNIEDFLVELHRLGCRRFIVSDLPFTTAVPVLNVARVAWVNHRGRWLSRCLGELLERFLALHGDAEAVHVAEVAALNTVVSARCCSRGALFLRDYFHPSHETHRRLAEIVASALPAHPSGKQGALIVAPWTDRSPRRSRRCCFSDG